MNIAACASALACSAALAAGIANQATTTDTAAQGGTETFSTPVELLAPGQTATTDSAATTAPACASVEFLDCHKAPLAETATSGEVFVVPAPTGDPIKDLKVLQAAVKDSKYSVIDGANGSKRQIYTINGMLEINRSLTIRNLEFKQLDNDKVVRTIYAAGGGTPITLRLENIKIERGPKDSEANGSVSDSAGIWTTNTTPQFQNIEVYGGGKGDGIIVVNADGGYMTDVYVHDMTWTPYVEDQADETFWKSFTLATLQQKKDWNAFTIQDFDGKTLVKKRVEEQLYGIVLGNVTGIKLTRPRVERLMTRFSDGMVYPYQSDGITVTSGNDIQIIDAKISHVAEGIDVPGSPVNLIDISGTEITDAPLFCFKTRGSYDTKAVALKDDVTHVTIRNSVARRCGMAAYLVAAGAEAWLQDTQAIDTGLGPDGAASPGIGTVAAYRFVSSSALPTLSAATPTMGMHIQGATISNPNSGYMVAAFHSENSASDKRTYSSVKGYTLDNPTQPQVKVATNFTVVEAAAVAANLTVASIQ